MIYCILLIMIAYIRFLNSNPGNPNQPVARGASTQSLKLAVLQWKHDLHLLRCPFLAVF